MGLSQHMELRKSKHVVLPESRPVKRLGESWPEILRRWLVECPQCAQVWLVVGARENDRHVCKDCGHGFNIRFLVAPKEGSARVRRCGA